MSTMVFFKKGAAKKRSPKQRVERKRPERKSRVFYIRHKRSLDGPHEGAAYEAFICIVPALEKHGSGIAIDEDARLTSQMADVGILVCDLNNPTTQRALARSLRPLGYIVYKSRAAALAWAKANW